MLALRSKRIWYYLARQNPNGLRELLWIFSPTDPYFITYRIRIDLHVKIHSPSFHCGWEKVDDGRVNFLNLQNFDNTSSLYVSLFFLWLSKNHKIHNKLFIAPFVLSPAVLLFFCEDVVLVVSVNAVGNTSKYFIYSILYNVRRHVTDMY